MLPTVEVEDHVLVNKTSRVRPTARAYMIERTIQPALTFVFLTFIGFSFRAIKT